MSTLASPLLAALPGVSGIPVTPSDADGQMALAQLESLEGQLTITVQTDTGDLDAARMLLPAMERRAGRVLANGWPTGVEVGHAMVHGGPYPATADGTSTSVGSLAIRRFLRPVRYKDLPDALLPAALRQGNPWGVPVLTDGKRPP